MHKWKLRYFQRFLLKSGINKERRYRQKFNQMKL